MTFQQNTPQLTKIHRNVLNGVTLISEIPNIINEEKVVIATGREKNNLNFK